MISYSKEMRFEGEFFVGGLVVDYAVLWYNDLIAGKERPNGHPYRDCEAIME